MAKSFVLSSAVIFTSCATPPKAAVNKGNISPGSSVTLAGTPTKLHPGSLKVGDDFLEIIRESNLGLNLQKKVTIVNVVPSIDTAVCEEQTHILGEDPTIAAHVQRVTISRDLPMAQKRFASAAKLENITYASDYKTGEFGKRTGLLMEGKYLLARGVIVLNKEGKVHYMQFVPEVTNLPDMKRAIEVANSLAP